MREIVGQWLAAQGYLHIYEAFMLYGWADIVAGRFAQRIGRRRPVLLEGVSVELKLHDVQDVLRQATGNRDHVDWSYAAMPCERVAKMRDATLQQFQANGVGLLAVSRDGVERVVVPARLGRTSERVANNLWRRCRKRYQTTVTHLNTQDSFSGHHTPRSINEHLRLKLSR